MRFRCLLSKWLQLSFILGLTYSYAMFQGGPLSWFIFYVSLFVVFYLFLLTIYPQRWIQVHLELPDERKIASETVTLKVSVRLKLPLPFMYLHLKTYLPPSITYRFDGEKSFEIAPWTKRDPVIETLRIALFGRRYNEDIQLDSLVRGTHHFQRVDVSLTDPFLFVKRDFSAAVNQTLTVYPYHLSSARPIEERQVIGMASKKRSFRDQTDHIAGLRAYLPGDKMSRIDWKKSAQTDMLMTKTFDPLTTQEANIMVYPSETVEENEWILTLLYWFIREAKKRHEVLSIVFINELDICLDSQASLMHTEEQLAELALTGENPITELPTGEHVLLTSVLSKTLVDEIATHYQQRHFFDVYLTKALDALTSEEKHQLERLKQWLRVYPFDYATLFGGDRTNA